MATIYGDMAGTLEARAKGQTLFGIDGEINYIYGDAFQIEKSKGGNDVLTGGNQAIGNFLYGDAFKMSYSSGGNDVLTGGINNLGNLLYGDAYDMFYSQGGNDVLIGGANTFSNSLYGDSYKMSDSRGGNDVLSGEVNRSGNFMYGDAYDMSGSRGGNDVLTGGANTYVNLLYGDAYQISDSQCGNDLLIAGDKSAYAFFTYQNILYGDAAYHLAGNIVCGNDRLISGTGNDDMWGDIAYSGFANGPLDLTRVTTGNDVFVFSANNGHDTIYDFRQGEDKIELQGVGVTSFDALMAESHLSQNNSDSVITFGSNTITVIGVAELTAADFLLT